jgi:hypothetical protein
MATINNQATLRTAVADWLNRSDLLPSQIDQFIESAESMIYDSLRIPVMETDVSFTITDLSPFYIPSDFLEAIELRQYHADGSFKVFTRTGSESISSLSNSFSRDVDKFIINNDGTINKNGDYTLVYYRYLTSVGSLYDVGSTFSSTESQCNALGDSNAVTYDAATSYCTIIANDIEIITWFIAGEPDLILYGALSLASEFLGDVETASQYERLFYSKLTGLNAKAIKAEVSGGPIVSSYSSRLI